MTTYGYVRVSTAGQNPERQVLKMREMGALGVCVEDMLLSLLAYVAQTEREKMLARQAEGIALARERGVYKGRAPKEFPPEKLHFAQIALSGPRGKSGAAAVLGCSRATITRMIEDGRLSA